MRALDVPLVDLSNCTLKAYFNGHSFGPYLLLPHLVDFVYFSKPTRFLELWTNLKEVNHIAIYTTVRLARLVYQCW
jgi:hypothetical protein